MTNSASIALIDPSAQRRAQITFALSRAGLHVEPFESLREVCTTNLKIGVYLVHDSRGLIAALANFLRMERRLAVLVGYSQSPSVDTIVSAMRVGTKGYIAYPTDAQKIIEAITSAQDDAAHDAALGTRIKAPGDAARELTPRERQVIRRISRGKSNKEIATDLKISYRTVEIHRHNVVNKLNASNSPEAVRIAIECGII